MGARIWNLGMEIINNKQKIKSFVDLVAWQEAHRLVILVYKITKDFPKEEIFILVNQMRRAAISVVSNVAEGFSRKNKKDKVRFYNMARGSLVELQSQLIIARDLEYLNKDDFKAASQQSIQSHKVLNGLISKIGSLNSKY